MADKQYTVLLVEDSKIVLRKTAKFLEDNGFRVITAEDGEVAIDIYRDRYPEIDVIVSDLLMPNIDGYDFALYNHNNNRLPFVAYTKINDATSAMRLLERGVYFYVQKPFEPSKFVAYILGAIHRCEFNKNIRSSSNAPLGNLDFISIPSTKEGLKEAMSWFTEKNKAYFDGDDLGKLIHHFNEILLNSYEHGSLGITEEEKTLFIQEGTFEQILETLEKKCSTEMVISQSTLKDHVAISIKDQGDGFNFKKYLEMTSDDLLERIEMPNGRGIYISTLYFDTIEYQDGGSKVVLVKSFTRKEKLRQLKIGEFIAGKLNISQEKFDEILALQSQLDRKLGDIALREGFITEAEKEEILAFQGKYKTHFGNAGIFLGLLKYSQLKYLLDVQAKNKYRIGELLLKKKLVKQEELMTLLSEFYAGKETPFTIVGHLSDVLMLQVRDIAETYNYKSYFCDKEEELLPLIDRYSPQLVFLDDQKGNGLKCAQDLYKSLENKPTKIAFFSTSTKKLMALTGYNVGIDYFLPLPFNARHLINIIIDADNKRNASSTKRVLIVDDSRTIRYSVAKELMEEGYQVLFATNGEEGVKIATLEKPDLITMDIDMPVMNGYDACKKLKENSITTDIPIIMITARNTEQERAKGFEVGVVEYLTKPFTKGYLSSYIQHLLCDDHELRKDRILVADDCKFSRSIFSSILNKYRFENKIVNGGQEVLDALEAGYAPSCILLDYQMPEMDGLQACQKIKADLRFQQIPVIIVTSSMNKNLVIQAIKTGADDYLAKPFDSDELVARTESHIKNYSLIKQLNEEIQTRKLIEKKLVDKNRELRSLYKKINSQLKETGELQQKLLPDKILQSNNFSIDLVYEPCSESGGDYYDFFTIGESHTCFLIADVSGHGASATVIMTNVRNYIRLLLNEATSPEMALSVLNGILREHSVDTHYLTMFYSIYDHDKNLLTYSNAGHFPPLFYKKEDDDISLLTSKDGLPLNLYDEEEYPELIITVEKGDKLLLYTDGYHESINESGKCLTLDTMKETFGETVDDETPLKSMMKVHKSFVGDATNDDDIALMLIEFN